MRQCFILFLIQKLFAFLITYDYSLGEFVLQIPYYPKIQNEEYFTEKICNDIITSIIDKKPIPEKEMDIVKFKFKLK